MKSGIKSVILFLLIFFLIFFNPKHLQTTPAETLSKLTYTPLEKSDIGLIVYSISDEKDIFSLNSDDKFFYASNLKLLTSVAAFSYLGRNFSFDTLFFYDKKEKTLYMKSGGDPSIVLEDINNIGKELKKRGVRNIKKVVVDDYYFSREGYKAIEGAEKGDRAYLAYVSPFSLNFNAVLITVTPGSKGKTPNVRISTPGNNCKIVNSAKTVSGKKLALSIHTKKDGAKTKVIVKGTIGAALKKGKTFSRKIWNPTRHYVDTLLFLMGESSRAKIVRKEIPASFFKGEIDRRGEDSKSLQYIFYSHESKSLKKIIRDMNKYSSNFIAECLQMYLGKTKLGNAGKGVQLLINYAEKNLGEKIEIVNGSGLGNSHNKLSPEFFMKLLRHIYNDKYRWVDFLTSLPYAGEKDGTLKKLKASYKGKMRAKTGTLTSVAALSGIMTGKSGELYLFTLVINNYPHKNFSKMRKYRNRFIDQLWESL